MAHSGKTITFATDLLPNEDNIYSLGSSSKKWKIVGNVTGNADGLTHKTLNNTTLNNTAGTFAFSGAGDPWAGTDWVGLQIGDSVDKFQITANGNNLLFRQNDSGGTNTSWSNWVKIASSANVETGDNNGQVKIAGTNVSVKGLQALAYKASLVASDIPDLNANKITTGTLSTDRLPDDVVKKKTTIPSNATEADLFALSPGMYDHTSNPNDLLTTEYGTILNIAGEYYYGALIDAASNNTLYHRAYYYKDANNTLWRGNWQMNAHADAGTAVGNATTPIYVTNTGVITAGTAIGASAYHTDSYFALASHGNHVPATQTANNITFLRNDNTWYKLTATDVSTLINLLSTGDSQLTANDYVITQYVGGGTTTTTYHRRKASNVVNATLVKAALGTVTTTAKKFLKDTGSWVQVDWGDLTGKPSTFSPSAHEHNRLNGIGRLRTAEEIAFNTTVSIGNRLSWCLFDSQSRTNDATNSPSFDASALNMPWDWGAYMTQIAFQNAGTRIQIRGADHADHGEGANPRYTPVYGAWREVVTATKATKVGDTNKPVYINATGQATAISYTIEKSVPSNAVFTDHYAWGDITGKPTKITLTGAVTGNVSLGEGELTLSTSVNHNHNSSYLTAVGYDTTNKKIYYTKNGSNTDVVTVATLRTDMGLSNALHFIGITSTTLTDGATTSTLTAKSTNSLSKTTGFVDGDVVMDGDQLREYVWSGSAWRLLGITTSSAYTQPATTATNTWIAQVSQGTDGKITATTGTLDTSGTWSGTATKATKANLTTTQNAIAYYTDTAGTFGNAQYVTYLGHTAANAGTANSGYLDGLLITGDAYGNPENVVSGTNGVLSYGDAGPQIRFNSSGQLGAMIFDHYDSVSGGTMGASFNFVTNQGNGVAVKANGILGTTRAAFGRNTFDNSYVLYSNGATYINGATTINNSLTVTGSILFPNASSKLDWNEGTYRQRIAITDDSTTDTAVFNFQQSSNAGSSYTNLFTIKDNGTVVADKYRTSSGTVSFIQGDTNITATVDWDTILTPGCYKVTMSAWGDAATYHGPNETQSNLYTYGLLFVMRGNEGDTEKRVLQIYFPHQTSDSNPIYCRMRNGSDTTAHSQWQSWHLLIKGGATSGHNHNSTYVKLDGSNTMTGSLNIKPASGEGGEIALCASTAETTKAGIRIDNYYGTFRIFGIASADGTTKTGAGTALVIDPYAKTITGGYTITGTLSGNATSASKIAAKLATTTKTTLLGVSATTALSGTATNVELIGDTGIYLTTTAGEISALRYSIHDTSATPVEKARLEWNSTDQAIEFIFA